MKNDRNKKNTLLDTPRLSLFDDFIGELKKDGVSVSSSDITELIKKLTTARDSVKRREDKERSRRAKEEAERKAEEERLRKEQHIQEVTSMDLPLDWENTFLSDIRTQGVYTESVSDALIMSLSNLARVDIEYISSITGKDYKTVICALKGSIFQNPETWEECFYKGWETAEEYLSGNLMRKWNVAQKANVEYKGYFNDNIKALSKMTTLFL